MFLAHSAILNGLPTDAMAEITIYNRQLHNKVFEQITTPSDNPNYKKYTQDFLTNQDDTIKNDIIKVVSGYTFEQFNQNSDAIKDTILEDMQNLFGKDYVIGVNFSKLTAQ